MTALRHRLTRTRTISAFASLGGSRVRREGFAVCGRLLCLEVEVEGVHMEWKMAHKVDYELVPWQGVARKTLCPRLR